MNFRSNAKVPSERERGGGASGRDIGGVTHASYGAAAAAAASAAVCTPTACGSEHSGGGVSDGGQTDTTGGVPHACTCPVCGGTMSSGEAAHEPRVCHEFLTTGRVGRRNALPDIIPDDTTRAQILPLQLESMSLASGMCHRAEKINSTFIYHMCI